MNTKIKLQEMFGVEATDEQVFELEKIVLAHHGFQIVNFNEMGKSYRIDPKKETTTEAE